jgi:hypothetical protein
MRRLGYSTKSAKYEVVSVSSQISSCIFNAVPPMPDIASSGWVTGLAIFYFIHEKPALCSNVPAEEVGHWTGNSYLKVTRLGRLRKNPSK